ncbi:MAG: D-arabinono-1,4-lactone oxidase [Halioglobus sp.]|nr:D-arabinono-1,4-lactone oxidase [Halioglobus sp.]
MVATAVAGAAPLPGLAAATGAGKRLPWRNWSGSQQCLPLTRTAPASVAELQELVASSAGVIRPVGAGHSFTALVPTDDTIVSLARMSGVIDHDPQTLQATVWAGSRLGELGQPLDDIGQALVNMPDIDEQALGGCLGTATHGTGATLGCMPTFVRGLQIVDATGQLHDCSADKNPDLFQAALVSLGALGIITQVRLQNIAPYRLRRETHWRSFDEIIETAEDLADTHRNFEFFYIPFSGMGFTDAHDITAEPIGSTEKMDTNEGAEDLRLARDLMQRVPRLRQLVLGGYMRTLDSEVTVEKSFRNYASERNLRFNEMEYHLPREHGLTALQEIREALEKNHNEVFFPIEFRYVRQDDIWLSPFYGRETCSIAVHRYFDEDFRPYFKTIEPIFRKYDGRPHWGKLNNLTRQDFAALYPHWDDFVEVRRQYDPDGRFLNPYLRSLFG